MDVTPEFIRRAVSISLNRLNQVDRLDVPQPLRVVGIDAGGDEVVAPMVYRIIFKEDEPS